MRKLHYYKISTGKRSVGIQTCKKLTAVHIVEYATLISNRNWGFAIVTAGISQTELCRGERFDSTIDKSVLATYCIKRLRELTGR